MQAEKKKRELLVGGQQAYSHGCVRKRGACGPQVASPHIYFLKGKDFTRFVGEERNIELRAEIFFEAGFGGLEG